MTYEPNGRHRRSIRLQDYDYSSAGGYFVTICTKGRECWFAEIVNGEMELSRLGEVVQDLWLEIPKHFEDVMLDAFIVMPYHVHGIIVNTKIDVGRADVIVGRGVQLNAPTADYFSRISPKKNTLSVIVRIYKGAMTRWCRQNGHGYFQWQRNYYERIMRNQKEFKRMVGYITNNPLQRELDEENPKNVELQA